VPELDTILLDNSLRRWLIALLAVAAVLAVVLLWRRLVTHRLRPVVLKTNTFFDDAAVTLAQTTAPPIVVLLALYLGSLLLRVPDGLSDVFNSAAIILLLIQVGLWGNALLKRWVIYYSERNSETNAAGVGTARLVGVLGQLVLLTIVLLLILDNIPGVEITALVAGLGIGGVAVALAVQNILSDLFASLSIAMDKPFVVGDFISVGEDKGTVRQIGLKTTRLESLSGEQLIFSNADLLQSRIRNFKPMEQRRVAFTLRVPYETPPERLRAIPELIRSIIEPIEQVRFDRAHLLRFDDLGLSFEIVYFVLTADFMRYADIQQQINLALIEGLAEQEVSFASLAEPLGAGRRPRNLDDGKE
jgi:small-conductance mechanosensitive channel